MTKVSILLPSLNVAGYIGRCIESVMSQTLKDIEILCIDAGSTDGTLELIKKYASEDDRIRLLQADRKSYGLQMNLGIRMAEGKYIGIVETDDWVDPDMYEVLYEKAEAKDAEVVKGLLYDVYENTDGIRHEIFVDYIDKDPVFMDVFSPDDVPSVHKWDGNIWNGIYRRDFLLEHRIEFNESAGAAFQDIGFQQLVLNEASRLLYVHNHFYHYRKVRPGASTWNPKCLRFIYGEYKRLIGSGRIKDSHKKWLYARMVAGFFYELKKALSYSDYDQAKLECPEALRWFTDTICKAIKTGDFSVDLLNETNAGLLKVFISDIDRFIEDYRIRMYSLTGWVKDLLKLVGKKEIIVFGAGTYGLGMTLFLLRNCLNIVGIADNESWIRNQTHYGMRIMSADDAVRFYPDAFFIIANKHYAEDIAHQLEDRGVSRNNMLLFDGSDKTVVVGVLDAPILVD